MRHQGTAPVLETVHGLLNETVLETTVHGLLNETVLETTILETAPSVPPSMVHPHYVNPIRYSVQVEMLLFLL